jgi:hypothetical protein
MRKDGRRNTATHCSAETRSEHIKVQNKDWKSTSSEIQRIALPTPAIGEKLSIRRQGEDLDIQEFISNRQNLSVMTKRCIHRSQGGK